MICRDGVSGFGDLCGECGLMGRFLRFRAAIGPDAGAKSSEGGAYAPIAAISGVVPMMFMTRLRL